MPKDLSQFCSALPGTVLATIFGSRAIYSERGSCGVQEGYYDNCIFHRILRGQLAQTGDPTGTGTGMETLFAQFV
jgi:cyclophilin family peptidyl-prolyl cis-trans isomerase